MSLITCGVEHTRTQGIQMTWNTPTFTVQNNHTCLMYFFTAEAPVANIHGSSCDGDAVSTTALSIDCANNLEDDDHYLGPYLDPPSASASIASASVATASVAATTGNSAATTTATTAPVGKAASGATISAYPGAAVDADANARSSILSDAVGTKPNTAATTPDTDRATSRPQRSDTLAATTISTRGVCKGSTEEHTSSMSKGALAGLIIGIIVGVAVLVGVAYYKLIVEGKRIVISSFLFSPLFRVHSILHSLGYHVSLTMCLYKGLFSFAVYYMIPTLYHCIYIQPYLLHNIRFCYFCYCIYQTTLPRTCKLPR